MMSIPLKASDHERLVAYAQALLPLIQRDDPNLAHRLETVLETDYAELTIRMERNAPPSLPNAFRQSTNSILEQTGAALGVDVTRIGESGA